MDSKMSQLHDLLREKLLDAFHKQTATLAIDDLAKIVAQSSPIDLACVASCLPAPARYSLYETLSSSEARADFLLNTDSNTRVAVLRQISDANVKELVEKMPPDEAVELLEDISERRFRKILEMIDPLKATRIREIKKHRRNTAGRLMTNEFFAFAPDVTIGQAAAYIREHPGIDLTSKIFVVNGSGVLEGAVPARNLIVNGSMLRLSQVMCVVGHTVTPDISREEVVDIVESYKIAELPVVDDNQVMVGVITYETVLDAVEDMADETIGNMAGTAETVGGLEPFFSRCLARAPWLVVTLLVGLVNVRVISSFKKYEDGSLSFIFAFIPLIVGMSGNIGIQCSTVLVRSMTQGIFSTGTRSEMVLKELGIGVTTGSFFGALCGFVLYLFNLGGGSSVDSLTLGCIVGGGLTGACLTGSILGVLSPLFFSRIGVDPAVASGPIVTAFNDFLSTVIYFILAVGLGGLLL